MVVDDSLKRWNMFRIATLLSAGYLFATHRIASGSIMTTKTSPKLTTFIAGVILASAPAITFAACEAFENDALLNKEVFEKINFSGLHVKSIKVLSGTEEAQSGKYFRLSSDVTAKLFFTAEKPIQDSAQKSGQWKKCVASPEVKISVSSDGSGESDQEATCLLPVAPLNDGFIFKLTDCERFTSNKELALKLNHISAGI